MSFEIMQVSLRDKISGLSVGDKGYITGVRYRDCSNNKLYECEIIGYGSYLICSYQIKII